MSQSIREGMSEKFRPPTGPAEFDAVEIVDRLSASRMGAIVESADDGSFVLHLEHEARIPEEGFLRWFDGACAWQAIAQMKRLDESRVRCELAPSDEWQAAPARRSVRTRVENLPLLVRILPGGRHVHTVCVEISDSGCRANWLGETPRVGDAVDITWELQPSRAGSPGRVAARVARIISRPFGAHHVCFAFEVADPKQAALVREWHRASLQDNWQRRRNEHAA
jgi:hypothetical protein